MIELSSASCTLRPYSSADELYKRDLDACIEGIERFPVTKRLSSPSSHFNVRSSTKSAVTLPALVESYNSLPSPPQSPHHQTHSSISPSAPPVTASMSRSTLHGGPIRGSASLAQGHQDVRPPQDARFIRDTVSNLAVQPAPSAGSLNLKRKAVRIVSAAGTAPSTSLPEGSPQTASLNPPTLARTLPTPVPSPASGPIRKVKVVTTMTEPVQLPQLTAKPDPAPAASTPAPSNIALPQQSPRSSLDDMFARLSATSPSEPSMLADKLSLAAPDMSLFSSKNCAHTVVAAGEAGGLSSSRDQLQSGVESALSGTEHLPNEPTRIHSSPKLQETLPSGWQRKSQDVCEADYLRKATEYLSTLPSHPGDNVHIIKAVAKKLNAAYVLNSAELESGEAEKLRARYIFAVLNYVNKKVKLNPKPMTPDFVKQALRDSNGDFLQLSAALVKNRYIALDSLEQVTQLCQNLLDVVPKVDDNVTTTFRVDATKDSVDSTTTAIKTSNRVSRDPLGGVMAWPIQEKREHGAIHRACVLKGVSGVESLNQLQALVWGGRLESISMPEPGSEHALVKFLTPEACQVYLDATENGIEVQGGNKKTIVFVDKQTGPSSINDVIQNCIDGDSSRCVRATGADDDWSDRALIKLARGKQQIPRDVDRIKQGKTARGHHYIEFRFGNIYHALNFKRFLMGDEDWEHCSIGYAPDPCELARGVHYKDADEEHGGSFG